MATAQVMGGSGRLPRSARLLRPAQFQDVFAHGRRLAGPMFRLHVWLSAAAARPCWPRLGIAVPKRVAALAVERNRIRRLVRESFRHRRDRLPAGDYTLVALASARGADRAALVAALDSLWSRASALKPDTLKPSTLKPESGDPTMPGRGAEARMRKRAPAHPVCAQANAGVTRGGRQDPTQR